MYSRRQLLTALIDKFGADEELAGSAIDKFVDDLSNGDEFISFVLDPYEDDPIIEGDLELDSEFVYSNSYYWETSGSVQEVPRGIANIELPPYEDKLISEDGEL